MSTATRERNLEALDSYDDADLVDHAKDAGDDIDAMQRQWLAANQSDFLYEFESSASCEWKRLADDQHDKFIEWAAEQLRAKYVAAGGPPWLEQEPEEEA